MSHILRINPEEGETLGDPIVAEIFRFDPSIDSEPRMQTYVVPYRHRMSILTLLREIYERQDPTLAFRNQQCGRGICGTCQVRVDVNGKVTKSCRIPLEPGSQIRIAPISQNKVIRDLVVNL
jgi:succinate dehydrogenase / fumarate reductase iron-sulfur subunit